MEKGFHAHKTSDVSEKAIVGDGTRIWHEAQVRENSSIGSNCILGKGVYIDTGVKVGDDVKIQNYASIYRGAVIEDDVFIGPGAVITNDLHPRAKIWDPEKIPETRIKKGASIGANATILPGLTVGDHAMVGAGSVVTHNVPPHALVYGNPAKNRGYICECGKKLEKEKKVHTCSLCNRKYELGER